MADPTEARFTISAIDAATGDVTVVFAVDGKAQRLSGMPIEGSPAELRAALRDYLRAYKDGLTATAGRVRVRTIPAAVASMVGQETS